MNFRDEEHRILEILSRINNSREIMTIAPGIHPYFAVDNPMEIFFNTKAERGNNNSDGYREMKLEESGIFRITKCETDGLKTVLVQGVSDMHLINHGLEKTNIILIINIYNIFPEV